VAGATQTPGGATLPSVLRLLPTGAPDPAWGDGGRSTEAPAPGNAQALDLLPLPDGRVLVVGTVEVNGDERAAAWTLRSDGRLDTSATRSSRFVLDSADASRIVSLTQVGERQLMLGVRVLTDAVQLEGHAFDPTDADALPKLRTRQPWPPAWTDAPVWVPTAGVPRWADPEKPDVGVAAVGVAAAASAAAWRSLVPGVAEVAAVSGDPGGAVLNPYAGGDRYRGEAANAGADWHLWAAIIAGTTVLVAVLAYLLGRPPRPEEDPPE
jgi:Domain of unknown function (DUF5122) beta-propeller